MWSDSDDRYPGARILFLDIEQPKRAWDPVVENSARRATLLESVNARVPSPRLPGTAVGSPILVLTVAMAVEQVVVAQTAVLTALAIAFGAVMLRIAIDVGISGGEVARRVLEPQFPERAPGDADGEFHL